MNTAGRIVVGVDGFESSTAALRWAIHQAKLTGAVVEAVTAWHIPPSSGLVSALSQWSVLGWQAKGTPAIPSSRRADA